MWENILIDIYLVQVSHQYLTLAALIDHISLPVPTQNLWRIKLNMGSKSIIATLANVVDGAPNMLVSDQDTLDVSK